MIAAAVAWAALAAGTGWDVWRGRVPNALALAAVAAAVIAAPELTTVLAAGLAAVPLLALAIPRLVGMGDVKLAAGSGALLGLAAVPWWWAWLSLGAVITVTIGNLGMRRRERLPFAPALLAAALVTAIGFGR